MKSLVIADSRDSCLGMELAGIEAVYARDPESIERVFKMSVKDPDIGIIFLTEKTFYKIEATVVSFKKRQLVPLITVIPDRHGYQDPRNKGIISRYIRESVGL